MRIVIPQIVRDAIPPTPYPAEDTFFVFYHQVKWTDVPRIADAETEDWWKSQDAPFEAAKGLWLANAEGKVQSYLPLGWAIGVGDAEPIQCKERFIEKGGKHYLLHGARWDLLKALPAGDITLSFNIDNGFFPPEEY